MTSNTMKLIYPYEPATIWQSDNWKRYSHLSLKNVKEYFRTYYKNYFPYASIKVFDHKSKDPDIMKYWMADTDHVVPDFIVTANHKQVAVFIKFTNPHNTRLKYKNWFISTSDLRLYISYLYHLRIRYGYDHFLCILSNYHIKDQYLKLLHKAGIITIPICNSFVKKASKRSFLRSRSK